MDNAKKLTNIEQAHSCCRVWTPIADAIDTFLRRRSKKMAGHERIWRLIHVWESIEITLASIAICFFRGEGGQARGGGQEYLRARGHCYGIHWDTVDESLERKQGSLGGSIDKWIDVLSLCLRRATSEQKSPFIDALGEFLGAQNISLKELINAWELTCDVPDSAKEQLRVLDAMRHVNTFRNRFAHVPFPHDGIDTMANALEDATEQLFSIEPRPASGGSVLVGEIAVDGRVLNGITHGAGAPGLKYTAFRYQPPNNGKKPPLEVSATPFIHVDEMLRPYVLTRLKGDDSDGEWEYTRFRAEAHSVVRVSNPLFFNELPRPTEKDYAPPNRGDQGPAPAGAASGTRAAAVSANGRDAKVTNQQEAMRVAKEEGDFETAIIFTEENVKKNPSYHQGWLRLGYLQREWAMRLRDSDPRKATSLFNEAIESLGKATGHSYDDQKARAFYERSKARYHLQRFAAPGSPADENARKDAEEALRLSPDQRYLTWVDYLNRSGPYGPRS